MLHVKKMRWMAALDTVGDYESDPTVSLEDVTQDIVFKTLNVSCACVPVLVFACVCVCECLRARRRYVFVRICICIFWILFVCARATGKAHHTQVREWMGGWSDQGL